MLEQHLNKLGYSNDRLIRGVETLVKLDLEAVEEAGIKDLSELSRFNAIRHLEIRAGHNEWDLSVLTSLPRLTVLEVPYSLVKSQLHVLTTIPRLRRLRLLDCDDLLHLGELPHLPSVTLLTVLDATQLTTLDGLQQAVPKLETFTLVACHQLRDVNAMGKMENLADIQFINCPMVVDVPPSSLPVNLMSFYISDDRQDLNLGTPEITDAEWEIVQKIPTDQTLQMITWHSPCGTAHCLAGWAAAIKGDLNVANAAAIGRRLLPSLSKYFFMTRQSKAVREMLQRIKAARSIDTNDVPTS